MWQLKQETPAVPPLKSDPWQLLHPMKPFSPAGVDLAAAPCWLGSAQPDGCPVIAPWQRVLLKQPGAVPDGGAGDGVGRGEFWPLLWQRAQTVALSTWVVVWV